MEDGERRTRSRKGDSGSEKYQDAVINGNGQKYDFDSFLKENVPEQYEISIIDDFATETKLKNQLGLNDVATSSFDSLRAAIGDTFEINLVDHGGGRKRMRKTAKLNAMEDPLDDSQYHKIHERYTKKEKQFTTIDKDKILTEVDNCIELLLLLGIDLKKNIIKETLRTFTVEDVAISDDQMNRLIQCLGNVTKLHDSLDSDELIIKYRMTIREIRSYLLNFFKIKMFETYLKKEVFKINNELAISGKTDNFIEPVTETNVNLLKKQRLAVRNKNIGSVVSFKFKDGVVLEIDPISSPHVKHK